MNRFLVSACVLLFPFAVLGKDLKVGDRVFVSSDVLAWYDGNQVEFKAIPLPAEIAEIKGNRFLLTDVHKAHKTACAWVHKVDLLQTEEALTYITEQIQKQPSDPYLWLYRGLVWREKHNPVDAINDFTEAIRLDPQFAKAYMERGLMTRGYVIERKLDTSFEDFSEVIRLLPNDPSAYAWRAYDWDDKGNIDNAINDYTTAIKLGDTDGSTYFYRGHYHQVKGEFDLALKGYLEGIRLDPDRGDFFHGIAWFLATCPDERYRDGKAAVGYAAQSQKQGHWPKWEPLDALAAAYAECGDFSNAIEWGQKALDAVPQKKEGDLDEIQKRLDLYRAGKPYRDPTMYSDVAWRRATSPVDEYRDGKVAIEFAMKACVLTEWNDWKCLQVLAAAYAESGNFTKAVEFGEKSLQLVPENRRKRVTRRLELYRSSKPFRDGSHTRYADNKNDDE